MSEEVRTPLGKAAGKFHIQAAGPPEGPPVVQIDVEIDIPNVGGACHITIPFPQRKDVDELIVALNECAEAAFGPRVIT